jgi:N-methylhydantoinase A/oxoprolinase/acetone carboxylase beta subunit
LVAADGDLLAFGGGGPMNACGIAEAAGFRRVIVPAYASVFSAYGIGFSDLAHQYRVPAADVAARGSDQVLAELSTRAARDMFGEGVEAGAWQEAVEVWGTAGGREVRRPFGGGDIAHLGAGLDDVGLQLTATHALRHLSLEPAQDHLPAVTASATGSASVNLGGEAAVLPVYSLKTAPPGLGGQGPALFRDDYLTCPVKTGWSFRVAANGDLILERNA